MAINTDALFEKGQLGENEGGGPHPAAYKDTHKLLGASAADPGESHSLTPSDALSLNIRGSSKSLNGEHNGLRSPGKSGSEGNVAVLSPSPSRLSFSRASSPGPSAPAPPNYLWLAVLSCFCPGYPVNIFAIYYAHMSRSVAQVGDMESAGKLGRLARLLSIISILIGLAVLLYVIIADSLHII